MSLKSLLIFTLLYPFTHSHLILNQPNVWGIDDGIALEQPLDASTSNWMCGNQPPENTPTTNFVAGQIYSFEVICGEKDFNSPGCLVSDWHNGVQGNDRAGCALGVAYSDYQNPANHQYISYSERCPVRGANTSFIISRNVRNCDRCVCSWAWAPSRKYSSPGQFYHNCFYCSITGGINNARMKQLDFINVQGAQYVDVTYNDIVKRTDIYPLLRPPPRPLPVVLPPRAPLPRPLPVVPVILPPPAPLPRSLPRALPVVPVVLPPPRPLPRSLPRALPVVPVVLPPPRPLPLPLPVVPQPNSRSPTLPKAYVSTPC